MGSLIPEETIRQILDRVDIVDVISSWVPLKQTGRNFKAPCPFHHEKTPSFVVNPDKQIFHCFGCGVGGNVISFVMQQEQISFPEALRLLADRCGVAIPQAYTAGSSKEKLRDQAIYVCGLAAQFYHGQLVSSREESAREARTYLKARGIDLEQVRKFQLGFAPDRWDVLLEFLRTKDVTLGQMEAAGLIIPRQNKSGYYDRFRNRIVFPIFDKRGRCIAFGARSLDKESSAKYINSPETLLYTKGHHLYGLNWARETISKEDLAVVVEGYVDFITPFSAGIQNVVASLGTALTVEQVRLLNRHTTNVLLLYDSDVAGEQAMMRSLDMLVEEGMNVRVVTLSDGDDPDSFLRKYSPAAFRERLSRAETLFDFKLRVLRLRHDSVSIEGRARISAQMLETVSKFKNAVVQAEYLRQLAVALHLSEEALRFEMNKMAAGPSRPGKEAQPPKSVTAAVPVRPVERDMLRLLLNEQSFIPLTKEVLSVADFHNESVRAVIAKVFELYDKRQEVRVPDLLCCFEDQKILQMISNLIADEQFMTGDTHRFHKDCLHRIRQDRLKMIRQDILRQMRQADQTGDAQKLDELMQEFNRIIKH
ncbi:MAG TPA: DNA primase [Candidatus Omnitrophota bacterium]|nr:DNA primase [Candidatus Omnitrophota bacterium]HPN55446.1 DNA primase [Candidatus Omnitrophota bacterium]